VGDVDGAVMIAHRRSDVADLNHRAGELLRDAGALGQERLHLPGGAFAAGDRVVIKRNMTAAQVAELLDVPVSTVREWGRNGTLPRVKLGRHVRFIRSRVEITILRGIES
jgi:excisionase family DNA binding protein